MSSFFFALVPVAFFTGARLAFSSAHVSQCHAAPSFRISMPTTSFNSRAISLKLLHPSALYHSTRVLLWAAWLPNQGDQPLRPPLPRVMPGRRSNGSALGPKLHSKGRTRRVYRSSLVQIGGRRVPSCVLTWASFLKGLLQLELTHPALLSRTPAVQPASNCSLNAAKSLSLPEKESFSKFKWVAGISAVDCLERRQQVDLVWLGCDCRGGVGRRRCMSVMA